MEQSGFNLYADIAGRTDGDVYIGVVGPVRTGKSTFITRFMEELVLPHMPPGPRRDRLMDELTVRLRPHHHDHPAPVRAR